jgi:hypothetical protein
MVGQSEVGPETGLEDINDNFLEADFWQSKLRVLEGVLKRRAIGIAF